MTSSRRRSIAACGLLLALAPPVPAAGEAASRTREADMVCVPAADGRTWECGTRANPPPRRGTESLRRDPGGAATPPPFLAAPAEAPPFAPPLQAVDNIGAAGERNRAPRGAMTPSPQPGAPAAAAPPPLIAAPRQRLSPHALPAPAPAHAAAAEPIATGAPPVTTAAPTTATPSASAATAAAATTAAPSAEPASAQASAQVPVPAAVPQPADMVPLAGRDAFLALPPRRATLQLARAGSRAALAAEWRRLVARSDGALARGTAYAVALDAGGAPQVLLLWSDFDDAAAARAAWDALAGFRAGRPAAYARRIGPLQDEVRRNPSPP
jgi:hypothetical protein